MPTGTNGSASGWQSVPGNLYTIQYKTDLKATTWMDDAANTYIPGAGGMLYVTSTAGGDEAFYRLEITFGP